MLCKIRCFNAHYYLGKKMVTWLTIASVTFNQSGWFPFPPTESSHTECFWFLKHHSVWALQTVLSKNLWNSQIIWHQHPCIKLKSWGSHYSLFSCLIWTFTEDLDLYLHAFIHCTAAVGLVVWASAWMNRCTGVYFTGVKGKVYIPLKDCDLLILSLRTCVSLWLVH